MKNFILQFIKWSLFISFFGSGWFLFVSFFFLDGPEQRVQSGLPMVEINSAQFWESDYEGDIPKILSEHGEIIIVSAYGFTDVELIGLVKLDDDYLAEFSKKYFNDKKIETNESLWGESILCSGTGDLVLSWSIQRVSLGDYFKFCSSIALDKSLEERVLELKTTMDNSQFTYMDIKHIVGTNYFVVGHGKS